MERSAAARIGVVVLTTVLLASAPAVAGVSVISPATADPESREALERLASLPTGSQKLLLTAAAEPTLLTRLSTLHTTSGERIRSRIASLEPHRQSQVWRLLASPELLGVLARVRSVRELETLLERLDDATASAARELALAERALLVELEGVRVAERAALEDLLQGRTLGVQATFRLLAKDPGAMAVLSKESRLMVSVGALYAQDPEATLDALDQIASEALSRHASVLPVLDDRCETPMEEHLAHEHPARQTEAAVPAREDLPEAVSRNPLVSVSISSVPPTAPIIPVSIGTASIPTWELPTRERARLRSTWPSGAPHPSRGVTRWTEERLERRDLRAAGERSFRELRRSPFGGSKQLVRGGSGGHHFRARPRGPRRPGRRGPS